MASEEELADLRDRLSALGDDPNKAKAAEEPSSPVPASFVGRIRRSIRKEYKRREERYYAYGPPYKEEYGQ